MATARDRLAAYIGYEPDENDPEFNTHLAAFRAEVLREAADAADCLKREDVATPTTTPDATWYDGLNAAVQMLYREADAAGKDTPQGKSTCDADVEELHRYRAANASGTLFRITTEGAVVGELFADELSNLRSTVALLRLTARHGTLEEMRRQLDNYTAEEREGLERQQRRDGHTGRGDCPCPWCAGRDDDEQPAEAGDA
ncbi:hypothetical protein AB0O20_06620 [Streptomyces kronopolitis]|uniref:hypothetical protein n=1 Tax=Streptomyces kronopolitis TaxID=1612435 RepID=UPI003423B93F